MMLCVFDIDGTLANIDHRLDYIRSKPKNWNAFNGGISNDSCNEAVAHVFRKLAYSTDTKVLLASGRSETVRNETENWLIDNFLEDYDNLYMRKENDFRADDIIKVEILDQIIYDYGKKPDLWFDDRPRVVKAIRSCGVFVFDVYQGTEDF